MMLLPLPYMCGACLQLVTCHSPLEVPLCISHQLARQPHRQAATRGAASDRHSDSLLQLAWPHCGLTFPHSFLIFLSLLSLLSIPIYSPSISQFFHSHSSFLCPLPLIWFIWFVGFGVLFILFLEWHDTPAALNQAVR